MLSWDDGLTARSRVAAALRSLFRALAAAAAQQHGAGGEGGAPVPVNPAALREALAAIPGQEFQLGGWLQRGHIAVQRAGRGRHACGLCKRQARCPACRASNHALI